VATASNQNRRTSLPRTDVAGNRKPTENMGDARGQFGAFLRHWLDQQQDRAAAKAEIAKAAKVKVRAVGKWEEGANAPNLQSLDAIARVMGYPNWGKLAMAAVRFNESR
jgi:DNA-binding XRE family transcriptional regulator